MKSNAIVRIILYSVTILLLVGFLLAGMGLGQFTFRIDSESGTVVNGEASVNASIVGNLEIDWAAGDIQIVTSQTDKITFQESGSSSPKYQMTYTLRGDTLKLSYSTTFIGFGTMPSKDLTITVPEGWECKTLEIDGASLSISIAGMTVNELDLDGAANKLDFIGNLDTANIDGAACEITLSCQNQPRRIEIDGAACELQLSLPKSCGFEAELDGLSCNFRSNLSYTRKNDVYYYLDGYCKISASGISCDITVNEA